MALYSTYQAAYKRDQTFVNGNPISGVLTPTFLLENYLAGLPLTATATNADLSSICQQKIDAAIGEFETKMGTFVVPRQIVAAVVGQTPQIVTNLSTTDNPWGMVSGTPAQPGVDYDFLEPPYDYQSRRFENWSLVKTRHRPIIGVQSILFALPPNFGILAVPQPWITVDPNAGIIRIVPVEGAMAVTSPGAGMWLPFFTMGSMTRVPQFTQINYTAGVSPVPDDMIDAIAMLASAKVLQIYNAAFYPGVQSFKHSVDGFDQDVTLRSGGPFTAQINMFQSQAYSYINAWRQAHNGVRFASLGR